MRACEPMYHGLFLSCMTHGLVCLAGSGIAILLAAGCSNVAPPITESLTICPKVQGQVTLDGKPLAGARVIFIPVVYAYDERHIVPIAEGITDSAGNYQLQYSVAGNKNPGAPRGLHSVLITMSSADPSSDTGQNALPDELEADPSTNESPRKNAEGSTDQLPARYHMESELTARIRSSFEETIDFQLTREPAPKNP